MKKITVNSVIDEGVGAAGASAGVITGSILMKMAAGKVNPWLLPLIAFGAGYGIRLIATNDTLKDVGTGLLISGVLDGTKKALAKLNIAALSPINDNIPALSGAMGQTVMPGMIAQGLRGDYEPAEVVNSTSMFRR